MKLFVDDQAEPIAAKDIIIAKSSVEAILDLIEGGITRISLDHDLGGEDTGMKVIEWLEEHMEYWPRDGIKVHSMNGPGRQRLELAIKRIEERRAENASGH